MLSSGIWTGCIFIYRLCRDTNNKEEAEVFFESHLGFFKADLPLLVAASFSALWQRWKKGIILLRMKVQVSGLWEQEEMRKGQMSQNNFGQNVEIYSFPPPKNCTIPEVAMGELGSRMEMCWKQFGDFRERCGFWRRGLAMSGKKSRSTSFAVGCRMMESCRKGWVQHSAKFPWLRFGFLCSESQVMLLVLF